MRKGHEGLCNLARSTFEIDPMSGHWFVFISKHKKSIKILWWDKTGLALFHKKLEKGIYRLDNVFNTNQLDPISTWQLQLILEGIELKQFKQHKRLLI